MPPLYKELREEFMKKFSTNVLDEPFLESIIQGLLEKVADWWLSKLDLLLKEKIKEIEGMKEYHDMMDWEEHQPLVKKSSHHLKQRGMKVFENLIPRITRKILEARWRNNPPVIISGGRGNSDKVRTLLLQKLLDNWWKNGGHKTISKKIEKANKQSV